MAEAGLGERIELRHQDAATLREPDRYDAVWVPLPLLPEDVVPQVLAADYRCLRPGGYLLAGIFTGPPGVLPQLLTDLRTTRSGRHPWRPQQIPDLLTDARLSGAVEVARTWQAPVRLIVGHRK